MTDKQSCACDAAPKLIFSCSGAADVGEIADRAARILAREGYGNMFCLAGIGARISGFIKSAEAASDILAIDGCKLDCARKCLAEVGIIDIVYVRVTDHGFQKGMATASEENIMKVVNICQEASDSSVRHSQHK
jgi:uncharacterized metal-binding protein